MKRNFEKMDGDAAGHCRRYANLRGGANSYCSNALMQQLFQALAYKEWRQIQDPKVATFFAAFIFKIGGTC